MRRVVSFLIVVLTAFFMASLQAWAGHNSGYHWNDQSNNIAQVTHVNYAPNFPVYEKSGTWDALIKDHQVLYASNASACSVHCVPVVEEDLGGCGNQSAVYGLTTVGTAGSHLNNGRVRFNSTCRGRPTDFKRVLACHEFGHSTGYLTDDRTSAPNSCMQSTPSNSANPDGHDKNAMDTMYSHND